MKKNAIEWICKPEQSDEGVVKRGASPAHGDKQCCSLIGSIRIKQHKLHSLFQAKYE